ncbi:outer membrane lipoprotein-sorting protein [Brumicola nitratireducens]|uniref:Outer membrane protein n=1 Tax=Glaciecola nitratireducens (strain JCM 12485 / KCTC 12276 / FR1064) TaxID=1085623 RepID=G4QGC2_GLANF|nr:outer membrane lipoprotein-sorting protein [Glaciecola nitratireducens]AEP29447.1 outer membrane protein [Glaciecola nitratireducens FR1064]
MMLKRIKTINKIASFVAASLALLAAVPLQAASIDVSSIVKNAEKAAYYSGKDGRSDARMMIVDAQGRKQMRQFTVLRRDVEDNGDQQMMVFFERPADVKDTVFRVEKHVDLAIEDDRWLYLPALDLVKRISSGDKRTSFVGSHFFYEDVSGRAISEDNFVLQEDTEAAYILKATPKAPETVEFAYYVVTIDKKTNLPILIDFFKSNNDNYRRVEAVKIEEIQGFPTVVRSKVSDLESGAYTLMEFRNINFDLGLVDDVFTERSLRNPPREWLN